MVLNFKEYQFNLFIFTKNQQMHLLVVYYFTPPLLHISTHVLHHQGAFVLLLSYMHAWIPEERRKREHPRKTWMEGVQAAMTTRNLEPDQWRNREEWRLVSGRLRHLL
jgi:hypothetical protein